MRHPADTIMTTKHNTTQDFLLLAFRGHESKIDAKMPRILTTV